MNPTTQSPTNSVHLARQQRILRLPEVKAKTGFGRLALDWLRYLTQNSVQVRSVFQNVRQCFLVSLLPEVDGQVRRVAEKFALLASAGLSPDRAAKALMAVNYLVPDGNRPQRKVSLPDNTRPRMYCVKGSILDD